jgi:hypothetical protein
LLGNAEAKLMLASIVPVPSNVLSSTTALLKKHDARSCWWLQAITTSGVGLLSIAKSNDNKGAVYNNHLFFLLIALSDAIKKIVVLLTSESSNNSI